MANFVYVSFKTKMSIIIMQKILIIRAFSSDDLSDYGDIERERKVLSVKICWHKNLLGVGSLFYLHKVLQSLSQLLEKVTAYSAHPV